MEDGEWKIERSKEISDFLFAISYFLFGIIWGFIIFDSGLGIGHAASSGTRHT